MSNYLPLMVQLLRAMLGEQQKQTKLLQKIEEQLKPKGTE